MTISVFFSISQLKILGLENATSIKLVSAATKNMTLEQIKAALATTGLTQKQKEQILVAHGLSKEEAEVAAKTLVQSAANTTATATTGTLKTATISLQTAAKGLWATLAANPILLVVAAAAALVAIINAASKAEEKLSERHKEAASACDIIKITQRDDFFQTFL